MADLQHVGGPPTRIDRHLGAIIVIVLTAVLIAVVKPWGVAPAQPAVVATPTPPQTPTPAPTSTNHGYDLVDYGILEPPPMWEIWSAGTLASYSFALRIDMAPVAGSASRPSGPASAATGSARPSLATVPSAGPSDSTPAIWPVVRIPTGSHLELIAINRPLGTSIEIAGLVQIGDDGTMTAVQPTLATSPWPDHVAVFGLDAGLGAGAMRPWPPGHYRMDLRIGPTQTERTLDIFVDTLPTEATPATTSPASPGPGSTTSPGG